MNNSVVFNKIHMRNRIFNLHLFLSCLFIKSLVQKLLCLVLSWEQSRDVPEPSVGLACPDWLRIELLLQLLTRMWHLHGLQREGGITCRLGSTAGIQWEVAGPPSPEGQHPALSSISYLQGLWSFSASQVAVISHPGPDTYGGESCTPQTPCHLMCPTDKPSTSATKTSL